MKTIIGILILVGGAGALLYFWSDPFRTKVDDAVRQASKWTPENIVKDPDGYLSWAGGELDRRAQDLSARRLALVQLRSSLGRKLDEAQLRRADHAALLKEAKETYRTASATGTWPVRLRTFSLNEAELKQKVIEIDARLSQTDRTLGIIEQTRQRTEKSLAETSGLAAQIDEMQVDLKQRVEQVKLSKSLEGLEAMRTTVADIIGSSEGLVDDAKPVSVDDLLAQAPSTQDDRRFELIMESGEDR